MAVTPPTVFKTGLWAARVNSAYVLARDVGFEPTRLLHPNALAVRPLQPDLSNPASIDNNTLNLIIDVDFRLAH